MITIKSWYDLTIKCDFVGCDAILGVVLRSLQACEKSARSSGWFIDDEIDDHFCPKHHEIMKKTGEIE